MFLSIRELIDISFVDRIIPFSEIATRLSNSIIELGSCTNVKTKDDFFLFTVVIEDGRPAEDQGPLRGESRRSTVRESELAAEGVQHSEIELHETEEAPSAVQTAQNHVRATRYWPETLRAL